MIGSVYRIQFRDKYKPEEVEDIFYIGSTTKTLEKRWNNHKQHFNSWLRGGKSKEISIFKYFKEYGFSSFELVEIKRVIICDWHHLLAHEQLAINKYKCVNKLPCFNPIWRQNKIDKYNANYAKNKEKILEYQNEKFTCECGGRYTRTNKLLHYETKKHKKFIGTEGSKRDFQSEISDTINIKSKETRSMPFIDESDIILFGKYKGKHIDEIISSDIEYCLYIRDRIWIQTNERVMNKLNSNETIRFTLTAGPHKGCTIAQINEFDPEYVQRLRESENIKKYHPHIVEQISKISFSNL